MLKKLLLLLVPVQVFSTDVFLRAIDSGALAVYDLALSMRAGRGGLSDDPYASLALQAMAPELKGADVLMYDSLADYLTNASPSILTDDMSVRRAHADYYRKRAQALHQGLRVEPTHFAKLIEKNPVAVRDYFAHYTYITPGVVNQMILLATVYLALWRHPDDPLSHTKLGRLLTNAYGTTSITSILQPQDKVAFGYISRAYELDESYRGYFQTLCDALALTDEGTAILLANRRHQSEPVRQVIGSALKHDCVVS